MEIRRAIPEDAAALTEIAIAAKRHWGYSEKWIEDWRPKLAIEPTFIATHEVYVVIDDTQAIAFYALAGDRERLELQHLWVIPGRMRRGIGRALFEHALRRARELGAHQLLIESDPNAAGFYARMGARQIGTRVTEIDQQRRELPILMCAVT